MLVQMFLIARSGRVAGEVEFFTVQAQKQRPIQGVSETGDPAQEFQARRAGRVRLEPAYRVAAYVPSICLTAVTPHFRGPQAPRPPKVTSEGRGEGTGGG